ncbi:MAG TPA: hypothetical protein VEO01_26070 [Pseudonocardiaceae bacterium]|nr:hypothetical protein [Pseudonocardiaceae bacterium]
MITVTAECLRRRDEAHRIYQAMPPVDELPPFVHLSAYASMAELAAAFDDRETAAQMYRLLLPHADLFVCGGAGVIMIRGSVRYPLGVAAATMGRLDDAVRHLRLASPTPAMPFSLKRFRHRRTVSESTPTGHR